MTDTPTPEAEPELPQVTHTLSVHLPGKEAVDFTEDEARSVFHLLGDALREGHTPTPEVH